MSNISSLERLLNDFDKACKSREDGRAEVMSQILLQSGLAARLTAVLYENQAHFTLYYIWRKVSQKEIVISAHPHSEPQVSRIE